MRKFYGVQLSNGNILVVEERKDSLCIGYAQPNCDLKNLNDSDVDAYICSMEDGNVAVYCNSGDATHYLCRGLGVQSIAEKIAADYPWDFATGMSGPWQSVQADSLNGRKMWDTYINCKSVLFNNADAQALLLNVFRLLANEESKGPDA